MFGLEQFLEFNGHDLTKWCVVEDVRFPLTAPVQNAWHDQVSTGTGRKHRRSQITPTTIEIDIRIWEHTDQTLSDSASALAACLRTDAPAVLRVSGRNYNAILDGNTDMKNWLDVNAEITLRFTSGESTWFSDELTADLDASPAVVPISGTAPAYPVIEVTAVATVTTVSVKSGGDEVVLTGSWPAETVFRFDSKSGTVSIDGVVDNTPMTIGSRFPVLTPGACTVEFVGGSASLHYNPRWF